MTVPDRTHSQRIPSSRLRRRTLLIGAAGLVSMTAGCLESILGEDLEFAAEEAHVAQSAVDETGYEFVGVEEHVINRSFEAAGQTAQVEVVNVQAAYERTVDLGPMGRHAAAMFSVLSTPQVRVLGRSFNPVGDMTSRELAEMIQEQFEEIGRLEPRREAPVTILGQSTTETKFETEVTVLDGVEIDLFLHISEAIESGDDYIITVGGYPQLVADREEDHVLHMMRNITHAGA